MVRYVYQCNWERPPKKALLDILVKDQILSFTCLAASLKVHYNFILLFAVINKMIALANYYLWANILR